MTKLNKQHEKAKRLEASLKTMHPPTLALIIGQLRDNGMTERQISQLLQHFIKRLDQKMTGYITDGNYLQARLKEAAFIVLME